MHPYEEIRQELLEIKRDSERRLSDYDQYGLERPLASSRSSGELSQYDNHPADEATALYEREKDLALKQQIEEELRDVNHALKKMEEGTYGICEETGLPIPLERLKAIPTARTIREASYENHVLDYRPVEEDVLREMEQLWETDHEETEYNEQNAYQIAASPNESSMTFEDSSLIDNEDGMGYVEEVEAIASTDMKGYRGADQVHFQRNIQYDHLMGHKDFDEEREEIVEEQNFFDE